MSTHKTIRYERDDASNTGLCLYEDLFDENDVYLELEGFHFEASSMPELTYGSIHARPRVTVRFPIEWAKKLKLIE